MTALSPIDTAVRPLRYAATTFEAYSVSERHKPAFNPDLPWQRTVKLGEINAATVDEAVNAALASHALLHKEHLVIREEGPRGVRIHLFAIKRRSAARFVWQDHRQVRVHDLYAELVCEIDGGVL